MHPDLISQNVFIDEVSAASEFGQFEPN